MYIKIVKEGNMVRFVCVPGTSQLEGYHKHLAALLVGSNYSAVLAGALITMRNFRWGCHTYSHAECFLSCAVCGIASPQTCCHSRMRVLLLPLFPILGGLSMPACATAVTPTSSPRSCGCWTRFSASVRRLGSPTPCQTTSHSTARPLTSVS